MKYPRAPITEAVMDIRVDPRDDLELEDLRKLSEAFPEYSDIKDQFSVTAAIKVGAPTTQNITPEKTGFQFSTEPAGKMWQVQKNGWAFNKLAPYDSWEVLSEEGRKLWTEYHALARPDRIKRIAVRYINKLDLPLPMSDFKDYVLTVPEVAPDLPQAVSNFFMQVQIPQEDIEALAVINVALLPQDADDFVPLALDIDVFKNFDTPQDEDGIWTLFEALRKKKNELFEACITDAMRKRFQ